MQLLVVIPAREINEAIQDQLNDGNYRSFYLYGHGKAAKELSSI